MERNKNLLLGTDQAALNGKGEEDMKARSSRASSSSGSSVSEHLNETDQIQVEANQTKDSNKRSHDQEESEGENMKKNKVENSDNGTQATASSPTREDNLLKNIGDEPLNNANPNPTFSETSGSNSRPFTGNVPGFNSQTANVSAGIQPSSSLDMNPFLMQQQMMMAIMQNSLNDKAGVSKSNVKEMMSEMMYENRKKMKEIMDETKKELLKSVASEFGNIKHKVEKLEKLEALLKNKPQTNSGENFVLDNINVMEIDQEWDGNSKQSNVAPRIDSRVLELFNSLKEKLKNVFHHLSDPLPNLYTEDVWSCYDDIEYQLKHMSSEYGGPAGDLTLEILQNVQGRLEEIENTIRTTAVVSNLVAQHGVTYIGSGDDIDEVTREQSDRKVIVFCFSWQKMEEKKELWNMFQELMIYQQNDGTNSTLLALYDLERKNHDLLNIKDQIQIYQNGDLVCEDLFADMKSLDNCNSAFAGKYDKTKKSPQKKVHFESPCPLAKDGKCPPEDVGWICTQCSQPLDYGFDTYLYCSCGAAKVEFFSFRCKHKSHGQKHSFYKKDDIEPMLGNLRSFNGKTILILGETGVGKSTFINGFANYMQFKTLEEAKASNTLLSPVKSSFIITDDDFEQITVTTGSEENECQTVGQSATQGTKAHVFNYKGSTDVRLIDTPGIGDTRGIEQDKENFQNILAYISYYEEIHGICILLKPNNSRLTVTFEFCIKELLTHLHKDAAKNIVFCFTNARNTNYRPGDTFPALKKLLEENEQVHLELSKETIFCMDNESFRYLAAYKHGLLFNEEDDKVYGASWERATSETERMMRYFSCLKPHKVKDTLSINDVRRKILDMTKPLAEIAKHINRTISNIEDQKLEIQNSELDASQILAKINIQVPSLERKTLPYPRTVCTSLNCHEVHNLDGQKIKKFVVHCHQDCQLKGVQTDIVNNPDLKQCWAMGVSGGNTCSQCGCSWNTHMHVTYEMVSVMKDGEDKSAKITYQGITDRIKLKAAAMMDYERVVLELESEKKEIIHASAGFGLFIKKNSVIPYNDAMVAYMNLMIKMEKEKADQSQEYATLDALMNLKVRYEQEVQVMKDATSIEDREDISLANQDEVMNNLFKLKHFGSNMKRILTQMEEVREVKVTFEESRHETKDGIVTKVVRKVSDITFGIYRFFAGNSFSQNRVASIEYNNRQNSYAEATKNNYMKETAASRMNKFHEGVDHRGNSQLLKNCQGHGYRDKNQQGSNQQNYQVKGRGRGRGKRND